VTGVSQGTNALHGIGQSVTHRLHWQGSQVSRVNSLVANSFIIVTTPIIKANRSIPARTSKPGQTLRGGLLC